MTTPGLKSQRENKSTKPRSGTQVHQIYGVDTKKMKQNLTWIGLLYQLRKNGLNILHQYQYQYQHLTILRHKKWQMIPHQTMVSFILKSLEACYYIAIPDEIFRSANKNICRVSCILIFSILSFWTYRWRSCWCECRSRRPGGQQHWSTRWLSWNVKRSCGKVVTGAINPSSLNISQ